MKILPCMSKGVLFLHEDGVTFEMAPFQVWRGASGQTVIRIGNNTFFFSSEGRFDGTEHKCGHIEAESIEADAIRAALEQGARNRGLAPEEAYYPPGTPGFVEETRAWPEASHPVVDDGERGYEIVGKRHKKSVH